MSVIKLKITVEELDNVLQSFDRLMIYRSTTGYGGTYTEITVEATRIPLVQGQDRYEYDDDAGDPAYYYRVSYYNSVTLAQSDLSEPRLGEDQSAAGVLSVQELKDIFLFGLDLTDDAGNEFPDIMFEWGIRSAIAWTERKLDLRIKPTVFTGERYDYVRNDYLNWTIIKLRESPVISVERVAVTWPSNTEVIVFPDDWIQLRPDVGQINIVPTSGTYSQVLLTAGGSFLPLVASGRDFVPNILEVDFTAGFAEGQVPQDLLDLIGKLAAFAPLNVAGDLIVGAGIASKSVSIDGLSQSINTTSSATNAGYGARLVQYTKEIKEAVPMLRRYYKGLIMHALG
jgi:hypothetical protein